MQIPFKRVLVSKAKQDKDKDEWTKKDFKDELDDITFTLESVGQECNSFLHQLEGKQVLLADTKGIKVKETDTLEYFIVPQEIILCEREL